MRRAEDLPPALKSSLEERLGFANLVAGRVRIAVKGHRQPFLRIDGGVVV